MWRVLSDQEVGRGAALLCEPARVEQPQATDPAHPAGLHGEFTSVSFSSWRDKGSYPSTDPKSCPNDLWILLVQ